MSKKITVPTRSGRITRSVSLDFEPELCPETSMKRKHNISESDDDYTPQLNTPRLPTFTAKPKEPNCAQNEDNLWKEFMTKLQLQKSVCLLETKKKLTEPTCSGRITRSVSLDFEPKLSPETPMKSKNNMSESDDDYTPQPKTPRMLMTFTAKPKGPNCEDNLWKEFMRKLQLQKSAKKKLTVPTCSGRITRSVSTFSEPELSPVKTPMKSKYNTSESDDDFTPQLKTPRPPTFLANSKALNCAQGEDNLWKELMKKTILQKSICLLKMKKKPTVPTRSGRITRSVSTYSEPELSPFKTPMKRKYNTSESDVDFTPQLEAPRPSRFTATPKETGALGTSETPKTPRTRKRAARRSQLTPSLQTNSNSNGALKTSKTRKILRTPKTAARRSQLTPSLPPRAHPIENADQCFKGFLFSGFVKEVTSLPGREREMEDILSFLRNKLLTETSGCMYISGVPGTGKTATVCAALKILKEDKDLPDFHSVEVNGMKIAGPRQAYVQIYKQLTGLTLASAKACDLLGKRFTKSVPRRVPTVLILDELDALCTRRQDVIYNIVEWACHDTALLTVLAIANTMDLPERGLKARVASRLGLTRLYFQPYTYTQLQKIIEEQLTPARLTPDALEMIGRKVAAVSGDARRALALCSRAIELARDRDTTVNHVERAMDEATGNIMLLFIKDCSPVEKLMLRAVAAEVEKTGCDETTLSRALDTAGILMVLDGRPYKSATSIRPPTYEQARGICWQLNAKRLLLVEDKPGDPRLSLNVSVGDVHEGTRQISS